MDMSGAKYKIYKIYKMYKMNISSLGVLYSLEKRVGLPARYALVALQMGEQVAQLAVVHKHVDGGRGRVYLMGADDVWVPNGAQQLQLARQELGDERRAAARAPPLVDHLARQPEHRAVRPRPDADAHLAVRPVADGRAHPVTVVGQRGGQRAIGQLDHARPLHLQQALRRWRGRGRALLRRRRPPVLHDAARHVRVRLRLRLRVPVLYPLPVPLLVLFAALFLQRLVPRRPRSTSRLFFRRLAPRTAATAAVTGGRALVHNNNKNNNNGNDSDNFGTLGHPP